MIQPRLFLCSNATLADDDPLQAGRVIVKLSSLGHDQNVHIRFDDVAKVLHDHLSPRLIDLLEIAAYVYSADCATPRDSG